ncbi:hypothetical protein HpSP79_06190 [Helicobacter pylori]
MLYLMMILLIGALAGLAYWQHRQEKEWLENWFQHNQHTHKTAAPENTVNEPTETAEQGDAENVGTTDHSADNTAADDEAKTAEQPADQPNAPSEIIFIDMAQQKTTPPDIISTAEVTRLVSRPLKSSLQPNFRPDAIIEEQQIAAQTITPNDPALHRVRTRTLTELEMLRERGGLPDTTVTVPFPSNESVQLPEPSAKLETIEISDIQSSLHRQRQARQQAQAALSHTADRYGNALPVIPEDELWANLANRRPHSARLLRQNRSQTTIAPAPLADTPAANTSPVSIAPAASLPASIIPEPEIAEPVHFQAQSNHSEWIGHLSKPDTQKHRRYEKLDRAAIAAQVQAATLPSTQTSGHIEFDDTSDVLTEADFAAYYQEQNESAADVLGDSWESAFSAEPALPPLQLLQPPQHNPQAVQSPEELLENSIIIEEKLAEFKVKVKVLDAYAGPVITRYEIEPDVGVRGNSVINLEKDLARSLGVAAIRVVETIPGKTCMGLELPNPKRQMIRLREIFDSKEFSQSTSKLTLALGQDISGNPVVTDLAKAPHLLVAGTTGSGKSVGVNSMILSMLYKATPEEVRMIMIDPKMLELSVYEGIPHLLAPVVTDMKLAANALTWCVNEMEKRYRLMSHVGVRNLEGYNQKIAQAAAQGRKIANPFSYTPDDPEPLEKLPFIVVVVDEFADLMMTAGKQIEQLIARLAQKARAAGIHLILATQRPSVDVITGLIKANIPTRIAFQVSSKIDSRTVLDQMGAENLLGQGDMLFLPPGTGYPQRVHGAFVADNEVHKVADYWKQFGEPNYVDDILSPATEDFQLSSGSERDPLFDQAVDVILRTKKATVSSLQRHLRIGYNKAATLIEQLEEEGVVSPPDHSGKRTILARKTE